ncbi:MAG: BMP family ABC transporter substrate-binding protein, partial [Desulfohalobiaceae bacterium]
AGVPAIGYGTDAASHGAECALVSSIWNWGPIYVDKVKQVMNGTWQVSEYWGGFKSNNMQLSPFHDSVPQEVVEKVTAARDKLEQGVDTIFAGPLYDQDGTLMVPEGSQSSDKDLLTMRWLIQGVKGSIPD